MSTENFIITKRDGSEEPFCIDKIKNAILKACAASNDPLNAESLERIMSHLHFCNGMNVENIQNQVEVALMKEGHYDAAKTFIVYRNRHTTDRETAQKLRFLIDYCNADNAATGSKFDANANVENKNLATLIGEIPKGDFIRLNRRLLCDNSSRCTERGCRSLSLPPRSSLYLQERRKLRSPIYCASITMYPWLLNGTKFHRR